MKKDGNSKKVELSDVNVIPTGGKFTLLLDPYMDFMIVEQYRNDPEFLEWQKIHGHGDIRMDTHSYALYTYLIENRERYRL